MHRATRFSLAFLIVGVVCSGCGGSNNGPAGSASTENGGENSPESRGVIGYSMLDSTNPFFQVISRHMGDELKKHGYSMDVKSGDRDPKKQVDQIDDFIVAEVSAIVLNPCDTQSIGPAIKRANDAGIPVFTNDLKFEGDVGEVVCHVATNNLQGGRLAGEAMVKHLGESGGKVAILHYPPAESCQMRVKGFLEVVEQHNAASDAPKIEIVETLDGEGARDRGYEVTNAIIEANPDLAAMFCINDPSALGAHAALESVGKADQVTLIAFDGQLIGKQAILEGKILCDPIQFPDRIGRITAEMVVKHFNGDEVEKEILIPSEIYYKADAEKDPELR